MIYTYKEQWPSFIIIINLKRRLIDLILFSKYNNSFLIYDFGSFFGGRFLSIKISDKSVIK